MFWSFNMRKLAMLNLSELTTEYIQSTFQQEFIPVLQDSFFLMEELGLKHYETEFEQLITGSDYVDKDEIKDIFTDKVKMLLIDIIYQHNITIDKESDVSIAELNEMCHFLLLVQNLEDTDYLSYRVYAQDTPKRIIVSLATKYSKLEEFRVMEIVEDVSVKLIKALQALVKDKQDPSKPIELMHRKEWLLFNKFINDTPTLGKTYYESGFTNNSLNDILSLTKLELNVYVEEKIKVSPVETALDILSMLFLSKEHYQTPMLAFEQNAKTFASNIESVTRLKDIISHMLNDYYSYKKACQEAEMLNSKEITQ